MRPPRDARASGDRLLWIDCDDLPAKQDKIGFLGSLDSRGESEAGDTNGN